MLWATHSWCSFYQDVFLVEATRVVQAPKGNSEAQVQEGHLGHCEGQKSFRLLVSCSGRMVLPTW